MPRALLLLLTLFPLGQAQERTSTKEPITLPGFESGSPEQKTVQALIQKGASEDRMGDYNAAVRTFQDALQKLRGLPRMNGDADSVLVRLGRAYIGARRLDDALNAFSLLLGPHTEDCRPDVAAV